MAVASVQHAHAYGNGSMPSLVFGSTPTVGNMVVLFYIGGDTGVASGAVINGWTRQLHNFSASQTIVVFSRIVQAGDTATYGAAVASTGSDNSIVGYEVSGAASTWAAALDQSELVFNAASTTTSVTALTTGFANELALLAYGYAGGFLAAAPTLSGASFTQDESQSNAFGPIGSGSKQVAAAGTTGSPTIAWNATSTASNYVMITLAGASAGETAGVTTKLGGVSQSLSGGKLEAGTITTTLRGIGQAMASAVAHTANITTHLLGISQKVTATDLTVESGVIRFWTFGG